MVKPRFKKEEMIEWVKEILKEAGQPVTLRWIFYRLVSHYGVPNLKSRFKVLSKYLARAREQGIISWKMIVDDQRGVEGSTPYYNTPRRRSRIWIRLLFDKAKNHSIDRFSFQPNWVEVWIEKQALTRLLAEPITNAGVLYVPSHGYSSVSFLRKCANRIIKIGKPTFILYLGDWDGSGIDIEREIKKKLIEYGVEKKLLHIKRVCLTKQQIIDFKIPPMMAKAKDTRTKKFVAKYGNVTAELDALHPRDILNIVLPEIERLMDADIEKRKIEFEIAEKEYYKVDIPRRLKVALKKL